MLILGFIQALSERHGKAALEHWSISAIDLDPWCSSMCAAQVLSNLPVHRGTLGELVVYRGNALGRSSGLQVVVHTTTADLTPDRVLSALHPSRVVALRAGISTLKPASSDLHVPSIQPDRNPGAAFELVKKAATTESIREVDLFAD